MNPWLRLFSDVFKFIGLLFRRPRLLLFLVIFVVGIGGIGFWIPLYKHMSTPTYSAMEFYRNLSTYLIAIAITSFAERFLLRKPEGDERNLAIFVFALGTAVVVPSIMILTCDISALAFKCSRIAIPATLWLWFIALGDSPAFEEADARSAIGGVV